MKKILTYAVTAAAAVGLWSCSSEEPLAGGDYDGNLRLTVNLPSQMSSRAVDAYGNGTSANKLMCMVYEDQGNGTYKYVQNVAGDADFASLKTSVQFQLAKGTDYKIVFWGYADGTTSFPGVAATNAPYSFDSATGALAVDYSKITAWSDQYDAFINCLSVSASGAVTDQDGAAVTTDVTLTRPFAQLNVGTDDFSVQATEKKYGTAAQKVYSNVKISNMATSLNPFTGEATGAEEHTFGAWLNPDKTFTVDGSTTAYTYLSMNYLLVPKSAASTGSNICPVEGTFGTTNAVSDGGTLTVANCPFQRNYQTNIFGSLLTNSSKFSVTIDPAFGTPGLDYQILTPAQRKAAEEKFQQIIRGEITGEAAVVPYGETFNLDHILANEIESHDVTIQINGTLLYEDNTPFTVANGHTVNVNMAPTGKLVVNYNGSGIAGIDNQGTLNIKGGTIENMANGPADKCILQAMNMFATSPISTNLEDVTINLKSGVAMMTSMCEATMTNVTINSESDIYALSLGAMPFKATKFHATNLNINAINNQGGSVDIQGMASADDEIVFEDCHINAGMTQTAANKTGLIGAVFIIHNNPTFTVRGGTYTCPQPTGWNPDDYTMSFPTYADYHNAPFTFLPDGGGCTVNIEGGKFVARWYTTFSTGTPMSINNKCTCNLGTGMSWQRLTDAADLAAGLNWEVK